MSRNRAEQYHRVNKNRPREMSSKKPVSVFRDVFQLKKQHYRDPRFDDLSGTFKKDEFEVNYSFIDDIKEREKQELEKELLTVGNDVKRQEKIRFLIQRLKNQERSKKIEAKKKEEEMKRKEEVLEARKAGKKPYFPKKSEMKKKKLIETYQALQKSGKLEKYIEKKRKRIVSKDQKRFHK